MKKLLFYSSLCLLMVLFFGCTHQGDGKLPKVTTGNIALTPYHRHYLVSGFIEANEAVVLTYGICYSMSNKKPDINGHHIDATRYCSAYCGGSPIRQGNQKQSIVVHFIEDPEYDESMWENWDVIYVRAYATTADGNVVYGKTETYHPEDCRLPEWCDLLTRTNGWKLVSITDIDHGSSLNDIECSEVGETLSTGDIVFFKKHNYSSRWDIIINGENNGGCTLSEDDMIKDFFRNGSSESFRPDLLAYFYVSICRWGVDGTYYAFQNDLSNSHWEISTNEMRIKGTATNEDSNYITSSFNCELVFTPAP